MLTQEDIEAFKNEPTLDAYAANAAKTAIYPGQGSAVGLMYAALKLNGEAGELAEHVGKAMRDDGLVQDVFPYATDYMAELTRLSIGRRQLVAKEIGDVLWYCAALASEIGMTLSEIAALNLSKLADRQRRAMLSGSGDER